MGGSIVQRLRARRLGRDLVADRGRGRGGAGPRRRLPRPRDLRHTAAGHGRRGRFSATRRGRRRPALPVRHRLCRHRPGGAPDALRRGRLRDQALRDGRLPERIPASRWPARAGYATRRVSAGRGDAARPRTCSAIADQTLPVLLAGETGSARRWRRASCIAVSARAAAPFMAVNCAAIPAELLESELFGHEKGAFTGAAPAPSRLCGARQGRHALPRRDRRPAAAASGQAAAAPRGGRLHPGRRRAAGRVPRQDRRRHQPRPAARRRRRPASATTCSTGSTRCRWRSRRSATAPRTSPG